VKAPGPAKGDLLTSYLTSLHHMQKFDDVWFTYKARIEAEVRLKNSDFYSQILLVWYAFLSSAASVLVLRHEKFLRSLCLSQQEISGAEHCKCVQIT
jgi:hypothetical protein